MSDLIRREDIRTALKENVIKMGRDNWCDVGVHCGDIDAIVNSVPIADRPQGEWIIHFDDLFPAESTQECSVCHAEQIINGNDDNFCPNCGADMREREE